MGDKNIKIVKVDPTGFFVKKDEEESKTSVESDITDESSISSVSSVESDGEYERDSSLVHLPNAPTNVSVIKEENNYVEPKSELIITKSVEDINQANNYLNSATPKEIFQEPVRSTPFFNDTESSEQDTVSKTSSKDTSDYASTDDEEVIDMTDNTLYTVLAAVLEDEDGNNVSENLASINRHLEKHNDTMEKILNEYSEINRERSKERKFFEQLTHAVHNQNRALERMTQVMEIFMKSSGVKLDREERRRDREERREREDRRREEDNNEELEENLEDDQIEENLTGGKRIEKFMKKPSRRIETPENTGKFHQKIRVSKQE